MHEPRIAIIGAGLGGLVLARILQMHRIPATVYELDVAADVRKQGGSLDMHAESGQLALRAAGLYDQFRLRTHPKGEAMRILDKYGTVFIDYAPEDRDGGRPEIDRGDLRKLLISSLDPGTVQWGHKFNAARPLEEGQHELTFATGHKTVVDLLIGADGTWSRVRPLLSNAMPEYCGVSYLELYLLNVNRHYPESAALVGPGIFFALSDDKGLVAHGGQNVHLGASLRVPQDWAVKSGIDWSDAAAARTALLNEFEDWAENLKDLIRNCDDTITPRLIYALPIGHSWPHARSITLVGDAAHVMSPYAGEGANLAMLDATELALAIVAHGDDIDTALTQYEMAMFPRSESAAEKSAQGLEMCFSTDSPKGLVHFFESLGVPLEH